MNKCIFIYCLSALLGLGTIMTVHVAPVHAVSISTIVSEFHDPNGPVHVVAHKSDWRSGPENSLSAVQGAINMGVEMAEIDIHMTSDNQLVLMHDDTVDRTTNGTGSVASKTLAQIKALYLQQGMGGGRPLTSERVPTLTEVMNLAKGNIMINLDKAWSYRDAIWDVLVATGTTDIAIFKSQEPNSVVDAWMDSKSPRPLYAAVVDDAQAADITNLINGAHPDVFELLFDSESDTQVSDTNLNAMRNSGAKIFINSLNLSNNYSAGHVDSDAVSNPEAVWGWMINKGAKMIQTDYPQLLINYLNLRQSLPSGWNRKDIGAVGAVGSAGYRNGQFTLSASGFDIWTANDEFQYVYQPVTGDVTIISKVRYLKNTDGFAKAGIMIRESLNADSKFVDVVVSPSNGAMFQRRPTTGLNLSGTGTTYYDTAAGVTAPQYVKLVRSGSTFTAYKSSDGASWQQIGSAQTVSMNSLVYVGLAATSHNDGALTEATFSDVTVTPSLPYSLTTATFRQGEKSYSGATDAHVIKFTPYMDNNTGGHDEVEVTSYLGTSADEKNGLFKFSLSGIPATAIITSAHLDLMLNNTRNGMVDKLLSLQEVTGSWTEGSGVGINGQAVSGVNWNNRPSNSASIIDNLTIHSVKEGWYTFNITDLVQGWVDGSKTNNGVVLLENVVDTSTGSKDFASSENASVGKRPVLVITYR